MGNPRSPVETPRHGVRRSIPRREDPAHAPVPGYRRLDGPVPVFYPPSLAGEARVVRDLLARGSNALAGILDVEPPVLRAALVGDKDRREAPREGRRPYPPGLPYFTRSEDPPVLVLPGKLSPVFRPRTGATLPLAVWHELAHAFLLRGEVVRTPAWLGEFVAQAASAAVARRSGAPLDEYLAQVDRSPGFTVRGYRGPTSAEKQMEFQNLLLVLGAAALGVFGGGFLGRLFRALWEEGDAVEGDRAEELLATSLGPGAGAWLAARPEF